MMVDWGIPTKYGRWNTDEVEWYLDGINHSAVISIENNKMGELPCHGYKKKSANICIKRHRKYNPTCNKRELVSLGKIAGDL